MKHLVVWEYVVLRLTLVGLKATDLCKALDFSPKTLGRRRKAGFSDAEIAGIAELVGCPVDYLMDAEAALRGVFALYIGPIEKLEKSLPSGGAIAVISSTPIRERHDERILNLVRERLKAGVSVTYLYSVTDPAELHALTPSTEVIEAVAWVRDELTTGGTKGILRGYYFDNRIAQIVTPTTILVVFANDASQPIPDHVFQYSAATNLDGTRVDDVWLRLDPGKDGENYASILERCVRTVEPIPWLGIYGSDLEPEVQADYRALLQDSDAVERYRKLRRHSPVWVTLERALPGSVIRKLDESGMADRPGPLRVLDIGTGDGVIGLRVIAHLLRHLRTAGDAPVHWTAIDPARPADLVAIENGILTHGLSNLGRRMQEIGRDCELLASYRRLTCEFRWTTFEDFKESVPEYDVVLMIHSVYAMDLSMLKKAMHLLAEGGVMVVVVSPLADNLLNQICHVVDSRLGRRFRVRDAPKYKEIATDTFRNYAEDVMRYLREECDVETSPEDLRCEVPLDDDGCVQREYIEAAAAFFAGTLMADPEEINSIVQEVYEVLAENTGALSKGWTVERCIVLCKEDLRGSFQLWRQPE